MRFKQKYVIPLLVVIFAAPFAGAWLVFNFTDMGREGGASHGTLVQPPRPLPDAVLYDPFSHSRTARLHGRWSLVYLTEADCGPACREQLFKMRLLRLAVGKEARRVQRVLVVYGEHAPFESWALPEADSGQLLLAGGDIDAYAPAASFRLAEGDEPVKAGRLYLIDPLGNLMMSYARDAVFEGIVSDLKRLLRYSRLG